MLTANVIHRTFLIRHGEDVGTAFAIDRDSRQYLVTARHVTAGISSKDKIYVLHERQWKQVAVEVVGICGGNVDVAVLACSIRLAPPLPLEASSKGMAFGQRAYFVGFPFGWTAGWEDLNRDFPVPFVKTGFLGALVGGSESRLYLDGHGNRGFSGGPVVFVPQEQPGGSLRVAGIVSHYPTPLLTPLVDKLGDPIHDENQQPIGYFNENPGIVVAYEIRHATDLIDTNPIGLRLADGK
ncbi:MAG: serine protease [Gammaproteobacteria bacterium]|nr:serine protease [Gammaproteobacteria bacterium]